jgi:copper chaperone
MSIEIKVPDMACGACVDKITNAIRTIAPHAEVKADLQTKLVMVAGEGTAKQIKTVITQAGYTVTD